jgi:hypothetical protein
MTWEPVPFFLVIAFEHGDRVCAQQKSRRGTDHWSVSLAARLAWRLSRYSPVALCHRLSTALLWAAHLLVKHVNYNATRALYACYFFL